MFVLNWVKGGVASQISVAKTLALPFVPMALPPPNSKPRPSTTDTPVDLPVRSEIGDHPDLTGRVDAADNVPNHVREAAVRVGVPATFAPGISPMAPLNLTNVSSAITDEAKDPTMRTIRIDANKLLS
jgi:hypothetical protein